MTTSAPTRPASARTTVAHTNRRAPALVVTIDTEEEFNWSRLPYEQTTTITHTRELKRLQDALEEAGARPTYVVDYPLLRDDITVDVLRALHARGTCEIGAHLHPWVNPPQSEAPLARHTYLCNLPRSLQREKLEHLTQAYREAFGIPPRSFKAGRYGISADVASELQQLGYLADSSPVAFTSFRDDDGPDFRHVRNEPFIMVAPRDGHAALVSVPCSVAYTRRPFSLAHRLHGALSSRWLRPLRAIGILWHTRLLRKVFLSPEVHTAEDIVRGIDALAASGASVIHLSLHSPSIVAGHTPYVRSNADRDRLLSSLQTVIRHAHQRWGAVSHTLSDFVASRQGALL
jgi:hypothetical protein